MAEQLFEVGSGISLDNAVQLLYGSGVPGYTNETNSAPVGSSYNNTVDGAKWQKVSNIDGASGWVELAGKDAAIVVEHIASTGVILDQLPVKKATEFAWAVTAINEGDLTNKYSCLVHMSHNGTTDGDATNVTFDQSSILRQGAKIAGLQITGTLTGTGDQQFMNLHVASQTMVTFIAYRMVKNIAGSNTVILGGASLSNHVADGSVHLMPWQNTLLDGLNQSLNSTNLNSLLAITGNVQLQLDGKADAAATTTALSGKADTATVNTELATKQASLGFTPYNATNPSGFQTAAQVSSALSAYAPTWVSLTGKPTFATVATSGSYSDLNNKPSIPTAVSGLTNDSGFQTATQVTSSVNTAIATEVTNRNTAITAAIPTWTSLTGKPTVVSAFTNDSGYQTAAQVASAVSAGTITSTANVTTWTGNPYDLGISVFGVPANGEVVYRFLAVRAYGIPANFSGALAKVATVATASAVFSVQKNGVQIGTVTFAAGSTTGTFSTQAAVTFAIGDRLSVVAPATADATLADADITIVATVS